MHLTPDPPQAISLLPLATICTLQSFLLSALPKLFAKSGNAIKYDSAGTTLEN